jgi:hypothetical protein
MFPLIARFFFILDPDVHGTRFYRRKQSELSQNLCLSNLSGHPVLADVGLRHQARDARKRQAPSLQDRLIVRRFSTS